jgi:sorbitol-specific phosphotransferase system component IIBC
MNATQLSKKIMLRVYYAYGIALAMHPTTVRLVILTLSIALLARLVHVAMIYQSLLQTKVGDIGSFAINSFAKADWTTLLVTFVCIMTLLSFRFPVVRSRAKVATV